jgi:hypothetical protein
MSASELRADIEATTRVLVLVPIITLIGSYRCPFRAKSSTQCRIVQGLRIKTSRRDLMEQRLKTVIILSR